MSDQRSRTSINPAALRLAQVAQLLSRAAGQAITEEMLRGDVQAGAPTNADGTLNLVHYAAWLLQEMGRGEGDRNGR